MDDKLHCTRDYNNIGFLTGISAKDQAFNFVQNLGFDFAQNTGNLSSREDNINNISEDFSYDISQTRLALSQIGSTAYQTSYDNTGNITSKTGTGTYSYNGDQPHAVTDITDNTGSIPNIPQQIDYTPFNKVSYISEGSHEMYFTYGPDHLRRKTQLYDNSVLQQTKYFLGNYEKLIDETTNTVKEFHYLSAPSGLFAVITKTNGGSGVLKYVLTDHLGSIQTITDDDGVVESTHSYDSWGRLRNASNWSFTNPCSLPFFDRGYTGHEHLPEFGIINMNGRLYDPVLSRMLSPDNNLQMPVNSQNFNRYSYGLNNPLIYTDPSGEIVWAPIIIGAVIGTYMGGTIANEGEFNPGNWDYSSGKTWGYMLGGAIAGGLSGYVGGAIAAADIPMANTLAVSGASLTNSIGTYAYTGGQTDISVSFGVGTYNFSNNTWDGIWNWKENSTLENIGYTFGALANIQDLAALNMGGSVDYNSLKHPTGHGSLTNPNGTIDISKGFESGNILWGGKGMKWGTAPVNELFPRIRINNVNENLLEWMTGNISLATDKGLLGISEASYGLIGNTCASQVSRALTYAGVLGLNPFTIHPSSLYLQLLARQTGIYSSSYLYQMPNN